LQILSTKNLVFPVDSTATISFLSTSRRKIDQTVHRICLDFLPFRFCSEAHREPVGVQIHSRIPHTTSSIVVCWVSEQTLCRWFANLSYSGASPYGGYSVWGRVSVSFTRSSLKFHPTFDLSAPVKTQRLNRKISSGYRFIPSPLYTRCILNFGLMFVLI
jgi:hypothetical protein